jgi:hypothetical protein
MLSIVVAQQEKRMTMSVLLLNGQQSMPRFPTAWITRGVRR